MAPVRSGRWAVLAALLCIARSWSLVGRPASSAIALQSRRRPALSRWRVVGRGGASVEDDDDDDAFEDDDDDDDEDFEDDDDDDDDAFEEDDLDEGVVDEADFEGESLRARFRKAWTGTPPVTQVYVGSSLALTSFFFLMNANVWPAALHLDWKPALRGQVWRFATAFLYYGPFGLSYLLTLHFVWTYMSTLEKLAHAEPWDFAIMLLFGAASLLLVVRKDTHFLAHNLSSYLIYIWARTYEGQDVNVLEFFNIKAELLPWFFAAQTYLLEHQFPIHDLLGIALGWLYLWTRQNALLHAPSFFKALYSPALMAKYAKMADEFAQ